MVTLCGSTALFWVQFPVVTNFCCSFNKSRFMFFSCSTMRKLTWQEVRECTFEYYFISAIYFAILAGGLFTLHLLIMYYFGDDNKLQPLPKFIIDAGLLFFGVGGACIGIAATLYDALCMIITREHPPCACYNCRY